MRFVGFSLIELRRAIGGRGCPDDIHFAYEVTIYDKFGRDFTINMTMNELDSEWSTASSNLRMNGKKFAIMTGTTVKHISEGEFYDMLEEWMSRVFNVSG